MRKVLFWLHFKPKLVGKDREREREKIKISAPFCSNPMRNRKMKKIAKKFRKLKNTIMA